MAIHWQPYDTPRTDCTVLVTRWGDGVRYGGASWRAIHVPTQAHAFLSFDRLISDADALAQLLLVLDYRVAQATVDDAQAVAVRQPTTLSD